MCSSEEESEMESRPTGESPFLQSNVLWVLIFIRLNLFLGLTEVIIISVCKGLFQILVCFVKDFNYSSIKYFFFCLLSGFR